jgi:hypothetical protein
MPSTADPAPLFFPLQTVSSVNVDPQYALAQFCEKTPENEQAVIIAQGAPEATAAEATEGVEPSELNEREQEILKALVLLKATGERRRVSRDDAAKKADPASRPSSYYHAIAALGKRGLIKTRKGPNAGIWLLPAGISAADTLQSNLPTKKVE